MPLHPEIVEALNWMGMPRTGPIFTTGSPRQPRRILPWSLSQHANAWLHEQGIEATMHQLRHWFGTRTYRASLDLRMTQELLGHSSPNTTTIYAAWNQTGAAAVVQGLSVGGVQ